MSNRKGTLLMLACLTLSLCMPSVSAESSVYSVIMQNIAPAIELGYSPSSLSSIEAGVPVYAPDDSIWFLSTSGLVVSAQLVSPAGIVVATRAVPTSTVLLLYTFSMKDPEGGWLLKISLNNSSTIPVTIPFVDPALHPVTTKLSNYSIRAGELNMGFTVSANDAFNLETCLASTDMNSTIVLRIPNGVGVGEILVNDSLHSATLTINGTTAQPFSFRYDLGYSYSFAGSFKGELIAREITVISSSTAFFSSTLPTNVTLTNNTSPRPGRYDLTAYFDSSDGQVVEQTSALLLANGHWLWMGACDPTDLSSLSFNEQRSLSQGPQTWPTALYLMYNINGVDSYSALKLNLNQTRIHILGSLGNATLSYLGFTVAPNSNILESNLSNGSLYLIGKSFPLSVQITPSFGRENFQPQTIVINKAYTDNLLVIPVGALNVRVMNNSTPLAGIAITVENGYGGRVSAVSRASDGVTFYLPAGSYNVTDATGHLFTSKSVSVVSNVESNLQFTLASDTTIGYLPYLLVSLLIVAIVLNIWLWIVRPKRIAY